MDYSEFKNVSGVYQIISKIDNKVYIGSSVKIRNRLNRHQNELQNNIHCSPHLQNSFNLYGNENFIFNILEYCDKKILLEREQFYLDYFKSYDKTNGYNICSVAGSPEQRILSKDHKNKISNSLKGHSVSQDTKDKIGNFHRGKKMSKESIELNRLWHTGIKQTEDSILKRAKQYSFIDSEGNIYIGYNLKRFCDEHKLHRPNMNLILKGIRKSHHGFKKY